MFSQSCKNAPEVDAIEGRSSVFHVERVRVGRKWREEHLRSNERSRQRGSSTDQFKSHHLYL